MPNKKKKPTVKKQNPEKVAHYIAVLVEGLRSDFRIVSEKVDCIEANIKKEMNERFDQQNERFNIIETVLKMHSQMLQTNEKRWEENEKRWEANDKRWEENQITLHEILKSIKDVSEKVDRHEGEIQEIKRKIA